MPKVSVIVPVYNVDLYLRACLGSICSQKLQDFEVILIDDGSKDQSGQICDDFCSRDNRFRVFHRRNHGVSSSRNFGIRQAKGEYICFVDSDDFIHEKMLDVLYNSINNSTYDVAMAFEENVYDTDTYKAIGELNEQIEIQSISSKDFFYGVTHCKGREKSLYFHLHGKLYRRNAIEGVLFDEDLSLSEDMLFNVKIFSKGATALLIPQTMYFRTLLRQDALTVSAKDTLRMNTDVFIRALDYVPALYRSVFVEHIMNRLVTMRGRDLFSSAKNTKKYAVVTKDYRNLKDIPLAKRAKQILLYYFPFITYIKIKLSGFLRNNSIKMC